MKKHSTILTAGIVLLALAGATQAREAGGGVRAVRGQNGGAVRGGYHVQGDNGATAAGSVRGWHGPQGAGGVTARRYRNDGAGNAEGGHVHAYQRPNGNTGYRGAKVETNADGSATRHSEAQRNAQAGTLTRSSDASRDAEGNTHYQRDVSVNGAGGNTVEAQVTRDNGTASRTVTCNGGECAKPTGGQ